jgi:hypothetical protein
MRSRCRFFLTVLPALGLLGACGARESAPAVPGVAELAADPILLSRVLDRCNANPGAVSSPECINARAAADRVNADGEAERARRAEAGFERAREARRRVEDATRQAEEARRRALESAELPLTPEPGR